MNTKKSLALKQTGHIPLKYFAPAVAWGIFISVLTLTPGNKVPPVLVEVNDKLIHAAIYFFTTLLIYLGFIRYSFRNPISREALWFIILGCMAYGGLLEIIQHYWIPKRNGDWYDFLANSGGSVLCVLFLHFLHGKRV